MGYLFSPFSEAKVLNPSDPIKNIISLVMIHSHLGSLGIIVCTDQFRPITVSQVSPPSGTNFGPGCIHQSSLSSVAEICWTNEPVGFMRVLNSTSTNRCAARDKTLDCFTRNIDSCSIHMRKNGRSEWTDLCTDVDLLIIPDPLKG